MQQYLSLEERLEFALTCKVNYNDYFMRITKFRKFNRIQLKSINRMLSISGMARPRVCTRCERLCDDCYDKACRCNNTLCCNCFRCDICNSWRLLGRVVFCMTCNRNFCFDRGFCCDDKFKCCEKCGMENCGDCWEKHDLICEK